MLIFAFYCFRTRFICLACLIICDVSVKTGYLTKCTIYCSLLALFALLLEGVNIFFLYKFMWSSSFNDRLTCWVLYLNLHFSSFHYIPACHFTHTQLFHYSCVCMMYAWVLQCVCRCRRTAFYESIFCLHSGIWELSWGRLMSYRVSPGTTSVLTIPTNASYISVATLVSFLQLCLSGYRYWLLFKLWVNLPWSTLYV